MKNYYKKRDKRLIQNGYKDYNDFLKSSLWEDLKIKAFTVEQGKKCFFCKGRPYTLHHVSYSTVNKNTLRWLLPICSECHQWVHDYEFSHRSSNVLRATKELLKEKHTFIKGMLTKKWFNNFWRGVLVAKPNSTNLKKIDNRVFSLRIITISELPETLHHSIQMIINKRYTLLEWVAKKEKTGDYKMLGLYHLYEEQVIKYLQNN